MLTESKITTADTKEKSYRLSDGGSLYLEVKPSGLRSWLYRYRLNGKQGIYVIGRYYGGKVKPPDHVTRERARRERDEARALVKQGKNPAQARRAEKQQTVIDAGNTFRGVAKAWIEENKSHWSASYLRKVETFLEANAYPHIGSRPIRELDSSDILDVIERIKRRGAMSVATEVRQWISLIFKFAIVRRLATIDHAAPLDGVIRRPDVKHKTPMSEEDIKEFISRVDNQNRTIAIALRLLLLLFPRPKSIQTAEWKEFDLDRAEWKIPGAKMKMRQDFICPLPRQAVTLLRELHELTGRGRWLFPMRGNPERHIAPMTLVRATYRLGYEGQFSPHCFRATGKTLLMKHGFSDDLTERQLAHGRKNKAKASYDFYEAFPERQKMLQRYANLIDGWAKGIAEVRAA